MSPKNAKLTTKNILTVLQILLVYVLPPLVCVDIYSMLIYNRCVNPVPTRLCHMIYCHSDKSYPCLVGIGLKRKYICSTFTWYVIVRPEGEELNEGLKPTSISSIFIASRIKHTSLLHHCLTCITPSAHSVLIFLSPI